MHAVKGGWVGQTFALANSADSDPGGGKKSRTRRSKAERKGMVESFIKKYQKSNNGNFPSLNLTHKEVGGSFYTVREIVREIIQENRVLGPAKVELLVEKNDQFLEQNPLGSIAVKPQSSVSDALHEMVLETSLRPSMQLPDGNLNGEEQLVNGLAVGVLEDGVGGLYLESRGVDGLVETARGLGHSAAIASTLVNVADVEVVETFPMSTLGEVKPGAASEMVTVNCTSLEKISVPGSESSLDSDLFPQLSLAEDQSSVDYETTAEKTPLSVEAEAHEVAVEASSATLVEVSEVKDLAIDSTDAVTTRRSANAGNGNNTTVDGEKSLQREKVKPGHDIRSNSKGSFQGGSTPPLDRINLESWKVASKDTSMPGKNPLFAILKALVDSFVKFWTEE